MNNNSLQGMDNIVEQAKRYFLGNEKYNCAQAVLAAFGQDREMIDEAAQYGGGDAPGGMCGAFYAVKMIVGEAAFQEITEQLEFCAGGVVCAQIRTPDVERCREFVGLAADYTETELAG